jgi:tetratricopeptide (TPR) repeat protein
MDELEIKYFMNMLRTDPDGYLDIVNSWINNDPNDMHAYFDRHFAWLHMSKPRLAIEDLSKVIEFNGDLIAFMTRGGVYRILGDHKKALEDFARGEALDPEDWEAAQVTLLYQADSHARLGDEASALACCARLQDDFWTPGLNGAPAGNKAEITERLKEIAAEARAQQS